MSERDHEEENPNTQTLILHKFRIPFAEEEEEEEEVVVLEDITEQRNLLEALEHSRASFTNIVDKADDGIMITDETFNLLYSNNTMRALLGTDPQKWLTHTQLASLQKQGRQEISHLHPELGERTLEVNCGKTQWQNKPALLWILRDISERIELLEQLRQTQKMESIGRLAGGIAHDFNNLLTIILNDSDLISESIPEGTLKTQITEIKETATRAAELTKRLLAFSRRQILKPQLIEFNSVLTGISRLVRRLLPENIEIRIETTPEEIYVNADPLQLEQIILNLAINARDAMPKGGHLVFSISREELKESKKSFFEEIPSGKYLLLKISDTGTGIAAKDFQHIFEPFFTTKEVGKGTGMGLAMAHGIIRQHGGRIECESEIGQGSVFSIWLPERKSTRLPKKHEVAKETFESIDTKEFHPEDYRILIVEDEDRVRKIGESILRKEGYHTLTAKNLTEAQKILSSQKPTIDLIFSDVLLPDGNGTDLLLEIADRNLQVKMLFTSGYTEDIVLRTGYAQDVINFLEKPYKLNTLRKKIKEILAANCRKPTNTQSSLKL